MDELKNTTALPKNAGEPVQVYDGATGLPLLGRTKTKKILKAEAGALVKEALENVQFWQDKCKEMYSMGVSDFAAAMEAAFHDLDSELSEEEKQSFLVSLREKTEELILMGETK